MSEVVTGERIKDIARVSFILGLGFSAIAACGASDPNKPSIGQMDADKYLDQQYKNGMVMNCTGESSLRADGKIRSRPNGWDDNEIIKGISEVAKSTSNVTITDPVAIKQYKNATSIISPTWYVLQLPNHQDVYVNSKALVEDNFICDGVANESDPVGTLAILN